VSPTPTQPSRIEPPTLFKKPSLEHAPSFQRISPRTSFNTSFNGTTAWSSQQTDTQPNTAFTSFNSDYAPPEAPKLTRTSSTTMGSLGDDELMEAAQHVEVPVRESNATTRSSTTWGSIDEDLMMQVPVQQERIVQPQPVTPSTNRLRDVYMMSKDNVSPPSPSGMSHHIRNIPRQNIFIDEVAEELKRFPYFILFICLRLSINHNVSMQDLTAGMDKDSVSSDPEAFWDRIRQRLGPSTPASDESKKVWEAAPDNFEGYTFKGRVEFNSSRSKPVFSLQLLPLEKENSSRFQRKFGSDRFLYLSFPALESVSELERFTKADAKKIEAKFLEWFQTEHSFLGRKWRAFHVEPTKKSKGSKSRNTQYGIRVVLFATSGIGITEKVPVGEMVNWFFPLTAPKNRDQSFCKAFARLDLGLSRTVPTLVFKPSQVIWAEDITADGTPEDARFNDPSLRWPEIEDGAVMNDGCSRISLGAAQEIWKLYKKRTGVYERLPTAFQARIGGAKGLWVVAPEIQRRSPLPVWIEISKSQRKFERHPEDHFDETIDPLRFTFEVVNYSTSPAPSDLHLSFITILVDRGVPRESIEAIMRRYLDREREDLLDILKDPVRTYDWVCKQEAGSKDNVQWQAALPLSLGDRVKLLLESGFTPTEEPYLGKCLTWAINSQHLWEEQKLRIPLGKSTFLFGVADPFGVLAPGEIHVQFSTWFNDEEERYLTLEDIEVLVARQPACRRSDLQKVRAVSHAKLGHMVDVVVFPTRGQYPLAGKLQGGDYDGDIFWLCWEPDLVKPFKNAPAPTEELKHADYGIKQHTMKLREIKSQNADEFSFDKFLEEASKFRLAPSLLGKVTNYLEKQAYAENKLYSPTLNALCDMHDLLVDAPKQGYAFTDHDFNKVKRKLGLPAVPETPAYKEIMELCKNAKEMGEAKKARNLRREPKEENAIDYLYFQVVRKHHLETKCMVEELLSKDTSDDSALLYPCQHERSKGNEHIKYELDRLREGFDRVLRVWNGTFGGGLDTSAGQYNDTVAKCYAKYTALLPQRLDVPEIKAWLEPDIHPGYSKWEILRASALYAAFPYRKSTFVFHMAGKELADLKCPPSQSSRRIVGPIYAILRPKAPKVRAPTAVDQPDGNADDSDDDEFTSSLEYLP
jgi:hypothetical protein